MEVVNDDEDDDDHHNEDAAASEVGLTLRPSGLVTEILVPSD